MDRRRGLTGSRACWSAQPGVAPVFARAKLLQDVVAQGAPKGLQAGPENAGTMRASII
jgi:hypothetical protein